jgi:hypothetical protein
LTRSAIAKLFAVLGTVALTASPAVAQEPGGYAYGPGDPQAAPAPPAAGGPFDGSLLARPNAFLGRPLSVRGTIAGAPAGRAVQVQRLGRDGTWRRAATTITGGDGSFLARWRTDHIGRFTLRAVLAGSRGATAQAATTSTSQVTVYRRATATFFGPGFYGRRTACGQTMSHTLQGVAHRSLPCGTLVDVYYKGHTARVPVVDRGPFRKGTSWDLTSATAEALGFDHTDRVGALRVPAAEAAPAAAQG